MKQTNQCLHDHGPTVVGPAVSSSSVCLCQWPCQVSDRSVQDCGRVSRTYRHTHARTHARTPHTHTHHTHARTHTPHTHTCTHTHMHAHTHTTHTRTHMHTHTTRTHTHAHHTHAHTHTQSHSHTNTHTQSLTHTHTCTHTQSNGNWRFRDISQIYLHIILALTRVRNAGYVHADVQGRAEAMVHSAGGGLVSLSLPARKSWKPSWIHGLQQSELSSSEFHLQVCSTHGSWKHAAIAYNYIIMNLKGMSLDELALSVVFSQASLCIKLCIDLLFWSEPFTLTVEINCIQK